VTVKHTPHVSRHLTAFGHTGPPPLNAPHRSNYPRCQPRNLIKKTLSADDFGLRPAGVHPKFAPSPCLFLHSYSFPSCSQVSSLFSFHRFPFSEALRSPPVMPRGLCVRSSLGNEFFCGCARAPLSATVTISNHRHRHSPGPPAPFFLAGFFFFCHILTSRAPSVSPPRRWTTSSSPSSSIATWAASLPRACPLSPCPPPLFRPSQPYLSLTAAPRDRCLFQPAASCASTVS